MTDSARFRKELVPLRPEGMSQKALTGEYRDSHPKWLTVQAMTVLQHFGRIEI